MKKEQSEASNPEQKIQDVIDRGEKFDILTLGSLKRVSVVVFAFIRGP